MKKNLHKSTSADSDSQLEQKAAAHFSAGRYKDASELYKELLKRSGNADWRQRLAQCYLNRALSIAVKGMPKEAVVLWENYVQWAEPPLVAEDSYVLWLLAAKNTSKAFIRLEKLTAEQLDQNAPELAAWLGFLLVSGFSEIAAHLPPGSVLFEQWGTVREALDAYRNGQSERIDEILKKVPFRSPFRDLRTLLKAALTAEPEQAQIVVSKIPEHSPYRIVADALSAYTQQGAPFVEAVLRLDDSQRRLVARAKGLSNKQLELLDALSKQKDRSSDKARFDLAIKYRNLFGDEAVQGFCEALLAAYPAGRKNYLSNFAAKDDFENHRIQALLCEQSRNGYDALQHWRQCIDLLKGDGSENARKIALILRHMAHGVAPGDAVEFRMESLDYDPDDRGTYVQILDFLAQEEDDPDEYEEWLNKALGRFPNDVDFLVLAAKSAGRRKAFKKASKYAQELLKIDPLNTLAKQLLFSSHMAHARRLIKTGKFHLVDKELKAGELLSIDKALRLQADLIRGFYVWAAEDKKQGLQAIAEALRKLNPDPVNAQFQGFIEAALTDVPFAPIAKQLPPFKDHELSEQELLHLAESIKRYDEQLDKRELLHKALDKINAPLKKSMKLLNYGEKALLIWCQTLEDIEHFDLLKQCAKSADGIWEKPIWSYYRVVAECRGDASRLDFTGMLKLQNAIESAREQNDRKAEFKIGRFIEQSVGFQNPFDFDDEEDFYADDNEFDPSVIEDLFGHVPERDMNKIGHKAEEIMFKSTPERLMTDTMKKYAEQTDPRLLADLFMNPNFLGALVMLEAAKALRIDIGLSFDDIVEYFDDDAPFPSSFPFF